MKEYGVINFIKEIFKGLAFLLFVIIPSAMIMVVITLTPAFIISCNKEKGPDSPIITKTPVHHPNPTESGYSKVIVEDHQYILIEGLNNDTSGVVHDPVCPKCTKHKAEVE